MPTTTFEEYKARVDAVCWKAIGLSIDDLPDVCLYDWYEDGITPAQAVRLAIQEAF